MEVKLSVKLAAKDMFDFMMKHTYSSMSGYIGIIISFCAFSGFIATFNNEHVTIEYKMVLILTSLLFTVIQPVNLYLKSKKQVEANENINKPIEYTISHEGLLLKQGEDTAQYTWDQIVKIASSKRSVFVYMSKYRSFILPKKAFEGEDLLTFRDMARKNAVNAKSIAFGKVV